MLILVIFSGAVPAVAGWALSRRYFPWLGWAFLLSGAWFTFLVVAEYRPRSSGAEGSLAGALAGPPFLIAIAVGAAAVVATPWILLKRARARRPRLELVVAWFCVALWTLFVWTLSTALLWSAFDVCFPPAREVLERCEFGPS